MSNRPPPYRPPGSLRGAKSSNNSNSNSSSAAKEQDVASIGAKLLRQHVGFRKQRRMSREAAAMEAVRRLRSSSAPAPRLMSLLPFKSPTR